LEDSSLRRRWPYPLACGLLWSYFWLIQYRSDFVIANEKNLLPDSLTSWMQWTELMEDFFQLSNRSPRSDAHQRHQYGQLRLQ
jgi:hypothetical protein